MDGVDAVVVGAGLGGLAAAVALAGEGRSVVVLEQHTGPGGYATAFRRGAYRFDSSLHALNGLAPGGGGDEVLRQLGIADRLRLHRLDPLYVLRTADGDVVAPADCFRYESELIRHFPREADGLRSYLDEVLAVYRDVRRLGEDQAAGRFPALEDFTSRYPALVAVSGETWAQVMERHVGDARAQAALGALWGYVGLPPSRCAAVIGAAATGSYHLHGGWYPEGGGQAITDALVEVLRERGGQVLLDQLVTGLETDGGRAVAALTQDGTRYPAQVFVSNVSAPATVQLVGADRLPADWVRRVAAPVPSYATVSVYLGLDRDVLGEQGLPHELFLSGAEDQDEAYEAALRGDWDRVALAVTDYTRVDPGCAPPGHAVVVLSAVAGWDYEDTWGTGGALTGYHDDPRYLQLKERATDALLRRADEAVPGLAAAVRERATATPLTNHAYTLNPRGAVEGYENSPRSSGLGTLPQTTPVTNLLLAGAWTGSGGMVPCMASGLAAAELVRRAQRVATPA